MERVSCPHERGAQAPDWAPTRGGKRIPASRLTGTRLPMGSDAKKETASFAAGTKLG